MSIFNIKVQNFGEIGASLILKFGEIGTLQNSGNLLKIWRDWNLPIGEVEVPPVTFLLVKRPYKVYSSTRRAIYYPAIVCCCCCCCSLHEKTGFVRSSTDEHSK